MNLNQESKSQHCKNNAVLRALILPANGMTMAGFSGYVLVGYESFVLIFHSFYSLSVKFHNAEHWLFFPGNFYNWILKHQTWKKKRKRKKFRVVLTYFSLLQEYPQFSDVTMFIKPVFCFMSLLKYQQYNFEVLFISAL